MLGGYGFLAKRADNYNTHFKRKPKKVVMVFRVITYSSLGSLWISSHNIQFSIFDISLTSILVYIYWLKWTCINAMANLDWGKQFLQRNSTSAKF